MPTGISVEILDITISEKSLVIATYVTHTFICMIVYIYDEQHHKCCFSSSVISGIHDILSDVRTLQVCLASSSNKSATKCLGF